MKELLGIFQNQLLWIGIFGWAAAQLIKVPLHRIMHGEWDISRLYGSGGMPSSHSSMTVSLAVGAGLLYGWDSAYFALAMAFAFIVMYDAAGVRRAAGKHARTLNQLIEELKEEYPLLLKPEKLREWLGHSPAEVIVGAALGVAVAVVSYLIW